MQITTEAWIWLAASLAAALTGDLLFTRALLGALRPPSAYVFLAARVGKLVAAFCWLAFFSSFWYPQYISGGVQPAWLRPAALTIGVFLLVAAFVTRPRGLQRSGGNV